jgi:hypothetical protein
MVLAGLATVSRAVDGRRIVKKTLETGVRVEQRLHGSIGSAPRDSSGRGSSKVDDTRTCPRALPGWRGAAGYTGTRRTKGVPARPITMSSPANACCTSLALGFVHRDDTSHHA